jgi:hypothetical protein
MNCSTVIGKKIKFYWILFLKNKAYYRNTATLYALGRLAYTGISATRRRLGAVKEGVRNVLHVGSRATKVCRPNSYFVSRLLTFFRSFFCNIDFLSLSPCSQSVDLQVRKPTSQSVSWWSVGLSVKKSDSQSTISQPVCQSVAQSVNLSAPKLLH